VQADFANYPPEGSNKGENVMEDKSSLKRGISQTASSKWGWKEIGCRQLVLAKGYRFSNREKKSTRGHTVKGETKR